MTRSFVPGSIVPLPATADDVGILLYGAAAARRELLPAVRDEAKRRTLGIVPCAEPDEVVGIVATRKNLLLCIIAWPDDQEAPKLTAFIEELRRRQANPLLEIIVSTAMPFSDTVATRLRSLRVTPHRRRETAAAGDFADILATAVRHAFEKRSLGGARPLSPLRTRGLIELAGIFGQALQRRNAGDLLRLLPLRGGQSGIACASRRRTARRRRKPAPCGLR